MITEDRPYIVSLTVPAADIATFDQEVIVWAPTPSKARSAYCRVMKDRGYDVPYFLVKSRLAEDVKYVPESEQELPSYYYQHIGYKIWIKNLV